MEAGWYPDPWRPGHHRYWNGQSWTGDVFADVGPPASSDGDAGVDVTATSRPPSPVPPVTPSAEPPPPPRWVEPELAPAPEPTLVAPVTAPPPPATPWWRRLDERAILALVIPVGLILGFLSVIALHVLRDDRSTTPTTAPPSALPTTTTTTPPPTDPAASALSSIVLNQSDVGSTVSVELLPGGTDPENEPTLDLCNGTFPSEALRTARLQVVGVEQQRGTVGISTEAVLYRTPEAAAQAMAELKATAAGCPASPVTSPVGEPTVTTKFGPAPDADWPSVPTVERLAFDFTATDDTGQARHSIAVYLRRGRVLEGVYFTDADTPPPTISGQTTVPTIVNVFAERIAKLPASTVGPA